MTALLQSIAGLDLPTAIRENAVNGLAAFCVLLAALAIRQAVMRTRA